MPDQQKIEIELALKNASATAVVQEIAKNLSEFVKNIGDTGKAGSGSESGITRTAKSVQQLGEKSKDTSKSVSQLTTILAPLVGPVGTVVLFGAGLAAVASSLDEFATKKLNLKSLSIDIGLSTKEIVAMGRTFERLGMSSDEAKERVHAIGEQLKSLQTLAEGSGLFRNLSTMHDAPFAKALLAAVKADKFYEAFLMINQEYSRLMETEGPKVAQQFLTNFNGMTESVAKLYKTHAVEVKESLNVNNEAMEKFHRRMEDIGNAADNVWSKLKFEVMKFATDYVMKPQTLGGVLGGLGGFIGNPSFNLFDKTPMGAGPAAGDPSRNMLQRKDHRFPFEQEDNKKEENSTLGKIRDSINNLFKVTPRESGGPVEVGKSYLVGERGPEAFEAGGISYPVGAFGPEFFRSDVWGTIKPSTRIEDRRGEEVPGWFGNAWDHVQDFRRHNPVAKWLYGNDYYMHSLNLPLTGSRLGAGEIDPATEIWTSSDYEQFQRGETPGMPSGRIRSIRSSYRSEDLDRILSMEQGGAPSLNAEISFRNVPPGVMTKADGDGFDNFKINKSKAF